jgi:hypothetical protein
MNSQPNLDEASSYYLVDCEHTNGTVSSGIAYYKNFELGANIGQKPDEYSIVTHGSLRNWRGIGHTAGMSLLYMLLLN